MKTTQADSGQRTELSIELARMFARFGPRFVQWMKAGMRDEGVSLGRLRLLRTLEQGGPQIMTSLRDALDVTARNITQLVDGLEADGLVRREPHPTDRRATVICLTAAGTARCHEVFDVHIQRTAGLFERLTSDEQHALLTAMGKLVDELAGELESAKPQSPQSFGSQSFGPQSFGPQSFGEDTESVGLC